MAKFLNTKALKSWITDLILTSKEEIVIVVPYIKTSKEIFDALLEADKKAVEITIVYRENKLSISEKKRISSLKNLNLLHHPNVHCKCYYNGELIIICSMNLYEYSEKNNREMGILLSKHRLQKEDVYLPPAGSSLFNDVIHEVREIMNGASAEFLSSSKKEGLFTIDILKTEEEKAQEEADKLNSYFFNKIFKAVQIREDRDEWIPTCKNYFDKVDIFFRSEVVGIKFDKPESELEYIYNLWMKSYHEYEFRGFKYYWNYHKSPVYLYRDRRFDWDGITDKKILYKKYKQGIGLIINKYRKLVNK